MADRQEVERLRTAQERRQRQEALTAEQTPDPGERRMHERRSDKAAYLREKLEQQARAPDAGEGAARDERLRRGEGRAGGEEDLPSVTRADSEDPR